jgi:hypothetical protein
LLQALVLTLEHSLDRRPVGRLFGERLRVPLAAGRVEEIAALNVNCAGVAEQRIRDRVNCVSRQRGDIACEQNVRMVSLQPTRHSSPIDVVLPAGVQAYQRPHAVIVSWQAHPRCPMSSEDRQRWRTMQQIDPSLLRRPESREHSVGIVNGTLENLLYSALTVALTARRHAILDESISLEVHDSSPSPRMVGDSGRTSGVESALRRGNCQDGAT